LLGLYIEAQLRLVGRSYKEKGLALLNAFEEDISIHGIGSVAELYDGDPSYKPHGCISFAVSVSEIIRMKNILNKIKSKR
jgi:glycogen debranching enzyme